MSQNCAKKWLTVESIIILRWNHVKQFVSVYDARGDVCKVQPHMLAAIRFCEGHLGKLLHSKGSGGKLQQWRWARAAGHVISHSNGSGASFPLKNSGATYFTKNWAQQRPAGENCLCAARASGQVIVVQQGHRGKLFLHSKEVSGGIGASYFGTARELGPVFFLSKGIGARYFFSQRG